MKASIQLKIFPFFEANFGYLFFKNLEIAELELFFESLAELFLSEECTPIAVMVHGDQKYEKVWKKSSDYTFDESNWITTWLNISENDRTLSGYFTLLGNVHLKSLISDTFNLKVFDTAETRFCMVGILHTVKGDPSRVEEIEQLDKTLTNALAFGGMERNNLVKKSLWLPVHVTWSELGNQLNADWESEFNQTEILSCINNIHTGPQTIIANGFAYNSKVQKIKREPLFNSADHTLKGVRLIGYGMEYIMVTPCKMGNTETVNQTGEKFVAVQQELSMLRIDWSHMVRGMVYAPDKETIKALKNIFKELKIPVAPVVFIITKNQEITFECDFCCTTET